MMNMNLLVVVTPQYISHGCSTQKTLWGEKFTGEETFFSAVDTKNFSRHNVRKHRVIKDSDKYVTLYIPLKFDRLDKARITSSDSKKIGKIRKGVDYLSGFQVQSKAAKIQKGKVCHQKCQ